MAEIPEFLFDPTSGPILSFMNADGVTSSSLFMNSQKQLTAISAGVVLPFASSATSSYVPPAALPSGIVSSSNQVYQNIAGSNINSGSAQTLISLQSSAIVSSSAQVVTLTSGQQISPTGVTSSLFGTSSWAINAITASYALTASFLLGSVSNAISASYAATASFVDARTQVQVGSSRLLRTSSLTISAINTWQSLPIDRNIQTNASDWTYSNGANTLTCVSPGSYNIDATLYLQKISGTAADAAVRFLKNGNEISGSYAGYTFASNNVIQSLAIQIQETFAATDTFGVQFAATQLSIQCVAPNSVASPVTRPSATIRVSRS